ncbi:MAG: Stp1/IreP family PP2C-type Ser/Thr phosphatase [Chloroflexi bacterium]|nr:Stp1/IreP family PP2C-type Ser/Thr phosphatase [Chloroflexota bacterium]
MIKLDPVALTDVGRRRNHNEDYLGDLLFSGQHNYEVEQYGYLYAVADGMGGHASGEVASRMAVHTLFDRFYNGPRSGDLGTDLLEAVKEANSQVHQAGLSNGRGQMGTTLTLALVKGNRVVVGNVGDSRTYLIRQGLIERVTHDHSLVQDQIDMGALTPEQAERSMIRNVITRAIGHRTEVEPDFFERELQVNDVLLLCSDGLHGSVHEDELGKIVGSANSLKEAAQFMINLANERGGVDNISVLLVGLLDLDQPIPTILNGRETRYAPPKINPTLTNRFNNDENEDEADSTTAIVSLSNAPTKPNPIPTIQPTERIQLKYPTNTQPNTPPKKKRGGSFALIGLVLLLLIVGVSATVVLITNSSNTNPTPSVVVASSPVATNSTTLPVLATVTLPVTNKISGTPISTTVSSPNSTNPTTVAVTTVTTTINVSPNTTPNSTSNSTNPTTVAVTTVAPSTSVSPTTTSNSISIKLTEIKKVQVILEEFSSGSYSIVMNPPLVSMKSKFNKIDNKTFETSESLGTGLYNITIESSENNLPETVTLNVEDSSKVSSSNTSNIRVDLKAIDSGSTLVITITKLS